MCSNYPGIKLERRRKNENVFKMSKDKNARAKIMFSLSNMQICGVLIAVVVVVA